MFFMTSFAPAPGDNPGGKQGKQQPGNRDQSQAQATTAATTDKKKKAQSLDEFAGKIANDALAELQKSAKEFGMHFSPTTMQKIRQFFIKAVFSILQLGPRVMAKVSKKPETVAKYRDMQLKMDIYSQVGASVKMSEIDEVMKDAVGMIRVFTGAALADPKLSTDDVVTSLETAMRVKMLSYVNDSDSKAPKSSVAIKMKMLEALYKSLIKAKVVDSRLGIAGTKCEVVVGPADARTVMEVTPENVKSVCASLKKGSDIDKTVETALQKAVEAMKKEDEKDMEGVQKAVASDTQTLKTSMKKFLRPAKGQGRASSKPGGSAKAGGQQPDSGTPTPDAAAVAAAEQKVSALNDWMQSLKNLSAALSAAGDPISAKSPVDSAAIAKERDARLAAISGVVKAGNDLNSQVVMLSQADASTSVAKWSNDLVTAFNGFAAQYPNVSKVVAPFVVGKDADAKLGAAELETTCKDLETALSSLDSDTYPEAKQVADKVAAFTNLMKTGGLDALKKDGVIYGACSSDMQAILDAAVGKDDQLVNAFTMAVLRGYVNPSVFAAMSSANEKELQAAKAEVEKCSFPDAAKADEAVVCDSAEDLHALNMKIFDRMLSGLNKAHAADTSLDETAGKFTVAQEDAVRSMMNSMLAPAVNGIYNGERSALKVALIHRSLGTPNADEEIADAIKASIGAFGFRVGDWDVDTARLSLPKSGTKKNGQALASKDWASANLVDVSNHGDFVKALAELASPTPLADMSEAEIVSLVMKNAYLRPGAGADVVEPCNFITDLAEGATLHMRDADGKVVDSGTDLKTLLNNGAMVRLVAVMDPTAKADKALFTAAKDVAVDNVKLETSVGAEPFDLNKLQDVVNAGSVKTPVLLDDGMYANALHVYHQQLAQHAADPVADITHAATVKSFMDKTCGEVGKYVTGQDLKDLVALDHMISLSAKGKLPKNLVHGVDVALSKVSNPAAVAIARSAGQDAADIKGAFMQCVQKVAEHDVCEALKKGGKSSDYKTANDFMAKVAAEETFKAQCPDLAAIVGSVASVENKLKFIEAMKSAPRADLAAMLNDKEIVAKMDDGSLGVVSCNASTHKLHNDIVSGMVGVVYDASAGKFVDQVQGIEARTADALLVDPLTSQLMSAASTNIAADMSYQFEVSNPGFKKGLEDAWKGLKDKAQDADVKAEVAKMDAKVAAASTETDKDSAMKKLDAVVKPAVDYVATQLLPAAQTALDQAKNPVPKPQLSGSQAAPQQQPGHGHAK